MCYLWDCRVTKCENVSVTCFHVQKGPIFSVQDTQTAFTCAKKFVDVVFVKFKTTNINFLQTFLAVRYSNTYMYIQKIHNLIDRTFQKKLKPHRRMLFQ